MELEKTAYNQESHLSVSLGSRFRKRILASRGFDWLDKHSGEKPGDFGRVGVLMGGVSSERDVSLKSGRAVFEALKRHLVDCVVIDINTQDYKEVSRLIRSHRIDCAFIALHGRFGEDGQIQRILEVLQIPYTCSGVDASRLAMDKIVSRQIFEVYGLPVPRYKILHKLAYSPSRGVYLDFGLPVVVKPACQGSSIGMTIVDSYQDLPAAIEKAFAYDENILLEEYIPGREVTVGILDEQPLPVIEIVPKRKFFDYEAKYQAGLTEYILPALIDADLADYVQQLALRAHRLLGCWGCSRIDLIIRNDNSPFILEVNTIPGFTATSLLPKAASSVGIDFDQLCLKLIELAYARI